MAQVRRQTRALTRTYIEPKDGGRRRWSVRFVDARTGQEQRCTREDAAEAVKCARRGMVRVKKAEK